MAIPKPHFSVSFRWSTVSTDADGFITDTSEAVNAMSGRNRPTLRVSLAPDVHAFLKQNEINASGLLEASIREQVDEAKIKEAAREAGVNYAFSPEDQCDTPGCTHFYEEETPDGRMCLECLDEYENVLEFDEQALTDGGEDE